MLGGSLPKARIDDACNFFHAEFLNLFSFFGYLPHCFSRSTPKTYCTLRASGQSSGSIA
jgi:hypothetical protein